MPKIVELRQDRAHIRSNFDGYKLSLDAVPLLRQEFELSAAPLQAPIADDQYSLLHAEMFSMQNLLHPDPWARTNSYFINRLGEVVRSSYDETTGRAESLKVVYRLGELLQRRVSGDYNCSMRFISEKYCVICDGVSQLRLLDTGDRLKAPEWKEVAQTAISETAERQFMLYDVRLDTIQEQKQISLALGRVQRVDTTADGGSSHYLHLHWAKWILRDTWMFSIVDTLEGKGSLYYCAFEPRAESLVISSNRQFKFRSASDNAATELETPSSEEKPQLHNGSQPADNFTWSQTDDDVVIKFDAKAERERSDYDIKCTATRIHVKCADELLLDDSTLFDKVDQDLTTWTIENNSLQITLVKQTSSIGWTSLLADGAAGPKESPENGSQSSLPVEQQPIVNLEAPIEDCDFPMGDNEYEVKIERFNLPTKSITHSVLLGSSPPLFATCLRPGFPPALATRQDVDACLWLQQYNPSRPEEWSLRHEGNLHAFGYVQASKQQKKFIDCSPDLNYAVICESHRHIFLYKSNYDTANGLRNRSGPQVTLGKQHLIALEEAGEVLGIATAPSVVTILTQTCVLYLQII